MAVTNPYLQEEWEEWKREMEENRRKRWRERVRHWVNTDLSDAEDQDLVGEEEEGEDVRDNKEDVNVEWEENEEGAKRDETKEEETDEEGGCSLEKRFQEKKKEDQDKDGEMAEGDKRKDVKEGDVNENEEGREGEEDWRDGEEKFDANEEEENNNDTENEAGEKGENQMEMEEEMQFQQDGDGNEEHQEQPGRYHLEEELIEETNGFQIENIWQNQESRTQEDVQCEEEDIFSVSEESASSEDSEKGEHQYTKTQDKDSVQQEDPDEKSSRNEDGIFEAGRNDSDGREKSTDDEETATETRESQKEFQDDDEDIQQESIDEDKAESLADEDEEYDNEDGVKIYSKDCYPANIFLTLSEFRDSSLLTDLTLQTVGGQRFCVHSVVLAAVSSLILENLTRSRVENCRTNERLHIDISAGVHAWSVSLGPEVDHVGLEAIVEFAYSGLISCLNKHNLEQVKAAAQTLGVPRVLDICAKEEESLAQSAEKKKKEKISAGQQLMISLQSIKQLWMDRVGCDVILETLRGSLHVHRVILAACSDYFRGMFTLGMKESNQPCVSLPFLSASDLEALVDSSYSGALPIGWTCVFKITRTALQLQHQPTLSLCLNFLEQEINPHTCLDVVSFAEAYEITHLREVADDFFLRQFQKVAGTSKFKDLPAKQLFKYLNSPSLFVPSELVVFNAVVAWIQAKPNKRLRFAKDLMKTVYFSLMTFKEFKEVQSQNMWADPSLTEVFEAIFEDFCSNETAPWSQCRVYLPKESLVLIGGDQITEELSRRCISRDIWYGNSLRNYTGIIKTMEWRRLGEMPEPARFSHEVAVLNGQLYVFGGKKYYGIADTLNSVCRYDLLQNSWEYLSEMQEKRCSFSVVALDGKIYAIGGLCDSDPIDTVECYCPTTNSWSFTFPLSLPLSAHVAKVLQGQIFISGGQNNDYLCLASMILYHPDTGSTYLANMTRPRAYHCMETLAEYLYVAGGVTTHDNMAVTNQLACEVYNPLVDSWTPFAPLPVPHVGAGSVVWEGKFYVLGGYRQEDYSDTKVIHRYDANTQKWENIGKMPGPNNDLRASLLPLPQHFRL